MRARFHPGGLNAHLASPDGILPRQVLIHFGQDIQDLHRLFLLGTRLPELYQFALPERLAPLFELMDTGRERRDRSCSSRAAISGNEVGVRPARSSHPAGLYGPDDRHAQPRDLLLAHRRGCAGPCAQCRRLVLALACGCCAE